MWQNSSCMTRGCVWGHIKHVTLHSNTIILTTVNSHFLEDKEMWEEIGAELQNQLRVIKLISTYW